jgi:hypothetical protein
MRMARRAIKKIVAAGMLPKSHKKEGVYRQ